MDPNQYPQQNNNPHDPHNHMNQQPPYQPNMNDMPPQHRQFQPPPTTHLTNVNQYNINEQPNGFAIAGFVCAFIFPLLGIIFSIIGLNKANSQPNVKYKGLAMAGIVISILNMIVGTFIIFSTDWEEVSEELERQSSLWLDLL